MAKSVLAFITLYGFSFSLWGAIGIARFLSQWLNKPAASIIRLPVYFAAAAGLSFFIFDSLSWVLAVFDELVFQGKMLQTGAADPISPAGISATAAITWAFSSIAGAYFLARILRRSLAWSEIFWFSVFFCLCLFWVAYARLPEPSIFGNHAYFLDAGAFVLLALIGSWFGGIYAVERTRLGQHWEELGNTTAAQAETSRVGLDDVAVLIPAHNEEKTIHHCLDALKKAVPMGNVFVGSDGSTDNTVEIVRQWGCNVLDIQPNGGKARAIQRLIDHYRICERYKAVLIMDADTQIGENYMKHALPLFDDPQIVAVAGHAVPKWRRHILPRWGDFFIAYRVRLYIVMQAFLRYGQTWKFTNVSYIIPGFSSMYRCSILPQIDITAPGLVIEDFNMTFEIHRKRCGKIGYTPKALSICEDPHSLHDYVKQVKRWNLGFWQTAKRHGLWFSPFWLALGVFTLEVTLQSSIFILLPALTLWLLLIPGETVSMWLPTLGIVNVGLQDIIIGALLVDYLLTVAIALIDRKPMLLVYGFGFIFLRWIDALIFLVTLPLTYFVESDGRWSSPSRA